MNTKKQKTILFLAASLLCVVIKSSEAKDSGRQGGKPNVLFIAIDDLNDWTGMLKGNPQAKTAHMDKKRNQRSGFWHGRIDELAFFGSALTSERIEILFQLTRSV